MSQELFGLEIHTLQNAMDKDNARQHKPKMHLGHRFSSLCILHPRLKRAVHPKDLMRNYHPLQTGYFLQKIVFFVIYLNLEFLLNAHTILKLNAPRCAQNDLSYPFFTTMILSQKNRSGSPKNIKTEEGFLKIEFLIKKSVRGRGCPDCPQTWSTQP